jgi:hypothetical protein
MSMSVTFPARLSSLPDDVLRALATFVPLSDVLMLVRCDRHYRMELQRQLKRCLNGIFVVTHVEEHWAQVQRLSCNGIPYQPKQRVLVTLFGEANLRANSKVYCFVEVDWQIILSLHISNDYATYYIRGMTQSARDRFASWLRYRCEQQLATETHALGTTTEIISDDTSGL